MKYLILIFYEKITIFLVKLPKIANLVIIIINRGVLDSYSSRDRLANLIHNHDIIVIRCKITELKLSKLVFSYFATDDSIINLDQGE